MGKRISLYEDVASSDSLLGAARGSGSQIQPMNSAVFDVNLSRQSIVTTSQISIPFEKVSIISSRARADDVDNIEVIAKTSESKVTCATGSPADS